MIGSLKRVVERLAGVRIYRTLPRGVDPIADLARAFPGVPGGVIFDVGANVGQSALRFAAAYPECRIYCFEPVQTTYMQLTKAVQGNERVVCERLAFGVAEGVGTMVLAGPSDWCYLQSELRPRPQETASEEVRVTTLDTYCSARRIERIGYLKIDTEGGDLEVLRGGEQLLSCQQVDLVEVEAGVNPDNRLHVPLETLKGHLDARGYRLFGIYEQMMEWPTGRPHLRRANLLFVSRQVIDR
jgi:FkbM family methyltransferase